MTRSPEKAAAIRALGAEPVVCDVCDVARLEAAVAPFRPDAALRTVTDLPDDTASVPAFRAANARIRREGTRNLLAAAEAAGAGRFLAQSTAWTIPGEAVVAQQQLERSVLLAGGVVLRYGRFYGRGTYYETEPPPPPRIQDRKSVV